VGGLYKASVDPSKNQLLFLATRKFAQILLASNSCIYSQHIAGVSNTVPNALSRCFDLDDDALTHFLNSSPIPQVQGSFKIYPVHQEISSWMICWMQKFKEMKVSQGTQKRKRLEFGDAGSINHIPLDYRMMYGCQNCDQISEHASLAHLPQLCKGENFLDQTKKAWLHQQCKRPWQNWWRSLGQTWGTTPHMETDLKPCIHYLPDNSTGCTT
jgi:hypothetical protein